MSEKKKKSLLQIATEVKLNTDCYLYDVEVQQDEEFQKQMEGLHVATGIPADITEDDIIKKTYEIVQKKFMDDEKVSFDEFVKKMLVAHGKVEEDKVDALYELRKGYIVANYIKETVHTFEELKKTSKDKVEPPFKGSDNNYCMMFTNLELFMNPEERSYKVDENDNVILSDDFKKVLDSFKAKWSQEMTKNGETNSCECDKGECHCHEHGESCSCEHHQENPEVK